MKQNQKEDVPAWIESLAMLGIGIFWVFRIAFKCIVWTASKAVWALDQTLPQRQTDQAILKQMPRANANVAVHKEFEPTVLVNAKPQQVEDFMTADRIVAIRLDPAVAVLHLRVYREKKIIKREMIVTEQRLRGIMQGRRHQLPDAVFDPAKGMDSVKEETVRLAESLINSFGQRSKPQVLKEAAARPEKAVAEQPTGHGHSKGEQSRPKAKTEQKPVVTDQGASLASPKSQLPDQGKTYVPRPVPGTTFEGVLEFAGSQIQRPQGRKPYETFEARIRMSNGVEVPLRGLELERELERCGVKLGDRVAITPQGKVPVTLPDGTEGQKNMYRVVRKGEAR